VIIENDKELDEALFQLEQFSLAKRTKRDRSKTIEVHQLVQAFLQDEVKPEGWSRFTAKHRWQNVVNLGWTAFPMLWAHGSEGREDCPEFQNELLQPMLRYLKTIQLDKYDRLLELIWHLEYFLRDEGSSHDAQALGLCTIEITL
jgi:hypothetical protein